jgi:hypothetical protein
MSGLRGHLGMLMRQRAAISGDLSDVQALFSGGVNGGLYDCTDPGTMWADTARTTPAVVDGVVRAISDLSGNGRHLSTPSTTHRLRLAGGQHYLDCPGTANLQGFESGDIVLGSAAGHAFFAAYRATDHAATMGVLSADKSSDYLASGIRTTTGATAGAVSASYSNVGVSHPISEAGAWPAGVDHVVCVRVNTSGGLIRRDGVETASLATSSTPKTTTAFARLSMASSFANANINQWQPYKGRIYCGAFIGRGLSLDDLAVVESFMAGKAGI